MNTVETQSVERQSAENINLQAFRNAPCVTDHSLHDVLNANPDCSILSEFDVASEHVLEMSNLHIHLNHANVAHSGNTISTQQFLRPLTTDLVDRLGGGAITLLHEIEDVSLTAEQATALGLIVTEAIMNAIRHGFDNRAEGGLIHLALFEDEDGQSRVCVSDSGKGLPSDLHEMEDSGMGRRIIDLYSRRLGGTAELSDAPLGGAKLDVVF